MKHPFKAISSKIQILEIYSSNTARCKLSIKLIFFIENNQIVSWIYNYLPRMFLFITRLIIGVL